MKGIGIAGAALLAALGLAPLVAAPVHAQPRRHEPMDAATSGRVASVDRDADLFTVVDPSDVQTVCEVDEHTTFLEGGRAIAFADLHPDDHVAVDLDRRDGRNLATYVEVTEEPPSGASSGD